MLANVPREQFSDGQIQMLVRNTQQMGAGLVMLGGPNSFGAGGWTNTELEEAMPVDFQIKNAKVVPRGALAMIMHASEMAEGNYWQKVIASEAIKPWARRTIAASALGPARRMALGPWAAATVGGNRDQMLARLDRMIPGDMPDFDPHDHGLQRASGVCPTRPIKHLIIISDGDPSAPASGTDRGAEDSSR